MSTAYESAGLRDGGRLARETASTAEQAAAAVRVAQCAAASFGAVAGAGALAAALARSRDSHVELAVLVGARHVELDGRAQRVAADGDGLTADTTALAGSGGPGSISAGMG